MGQIVRHEWGVLGTASAACSHANSEGNKQANGYSTLEMQYRYHINKLFS